MGVTESGVLATLGLRDECCHSGVDKSPPRRDEESECGREAGDGGEAGDHEAWVGTMAASSIQLDKQAVVGFLLKSRDLSGLCVLAPTGVSS